MAPKVGIDVDITVPTLEGVSGSGDVSVDGVRGDVFQTEVSGAGNVQASGQVDRVEAVVSGAGDVRLVDLVAREVVVEISGAGDIHVNATESLTASVSGAGDVIYTGDSRGSEQRRERCRGDPAGIADGNRPSFPVGDFLRHRWARSRIKGGGQ